VTRRVLLDAGRMADPQAGARVLTLDRDFRVYRPPGRRVIPIIMPADL